MVRKSLLNARLIRRKLHLIQKFNDFERMISWYIFGNKYFYTKYAKQISEAHKWCFVTGCNNSGTTLLSNVLERTGQVTALELEGQRYTSVLARARERGHERVWSECIERLRLTDKNSIALFPRLLHDWMREFSLPIEDIILEKTTTNAVRMKWLQSIFPNSHFIGIIRNGYAVTEGIIRKGNKSAERGAKHWNLVNKIMINDSHYIHNFLLLRYEDLVDNPGDVAQKLANFLSIDVENLKSAMQEKYKYSSAKGDNSLHLTNLNTQSISRLSGNEIDIINNNAKEMLDYFGYHV